MDQLKSLLASYGVMGPAIGALSQPDIMTQHHLPASQSFLDAAHAMANRVDQPSVPLAPPVDPAFFAKARLLANRVDQPSVPLSPAQGNATMAQAAPQPPAAPPAPAPSVPISLPNLSPQTMAQASTPQPPKDPFAGAPSVPVSLPNNSPPHPQMPWWASGDMTKMFPGSAPAAAPQPPSMAQRFAAEHPKTSAMLGIGQPAAPAAPDQSQPPPPSHDMGFFARNTAMMTDPMGGGFIDPTAAQAAASGPSLIDKMLAHLHNKDMG